MIYAIRKCKPIKGVHKTIDYRCYKHFNEESFLNDLYNAPWKDVEVFDDVNDAVDLWQNIFGNIVDKHIPKKSKRIKANPTPWLNRDIKRHLSTRDYLHRKALKSNNSSDWDDFKAYRNKVTNIIRKARKITVNKLFLVVQAIQKRCGKLLMNSYLRKRHQVPRLLLLMINYVITTKTSQMVFTNILRVLPQS